MISPWMAPLATLVISAISFLTAIAFHEFAHALAATLLGDHTPRSMGRLTLNPLAHIDPIGFFCLLVFKIGWAQPVLFDHRNFVHPRLYRILTALAGPCANFILALVAMYGLQYGLPLCTSVPLHTTLQQIFIGMIFVNLMLGTFNLVPIPPLDGSHVIMAFLEDAYPDVADMIYRHSIFLLIALIFIPQTRAFLQHLIDISWILLSKLVI